MAKKRLANSEVVRDLHREYTDGPDEIRVSVTWLLLSLINNVQLIDSTEMVQVTPMRRTLASSS